MSTLGRFPLGWKRKAAAFRFFDAVPGGHRLHYLTQRYVTRSFPRNLAEHDRWQFEHAATFRAHFNGSLGQARLFEFGAGWDLHSSFVQWCYGLNTQIVVDIARLARLDLVNHTIAYLRQHPPPGATRVPQSLLRPPLGESLAAEYGIHYRAPSDARRTQLDGGSIDLVSTTSVLEHVPLEALSAILLECKRLTHAGSVLSHVVDYTDHYAHTDPTITRYNFLRYSDAEWTRYNPGIHFQNRLRHAEYGRLFQRAGFRTLSVRATADPAAATALGSVPLAAQFQSVPPDELLPQTGHWVLAGG